MKNRNYLSLVTDMEKLIELKTADLTGEALNWSVAKAVGLQPFLAEPNYGNPHRVMVRYTPDGCHFEQQKRYRPSTDWGQGGPLMDVHSKGFGVVQDGSNSRWRSFAYGQATTTQRMCGGETILIAFCRALVALNLGDTVSVPSELIP